MVWRRAIIAALVCDQQCALRSQLQSRPAGESRARRCRMRPAAVDPNGGRPPRINQWNISLQREVTKDLVLEASYVGNRGAWLQSGGNLISYNAINPSVYQKLGLDITNADDAHAAHVVDHFAARGSRRVHEAVCELPGHRHGDSEPAAISAVQRHRLPVGAAGRVLVRRLAGEAHQALLARPHDDRSVCVLQDPGQLFAAPATSSTGVRSRASRPTTGRTS